MREAPRRDLSRVLEYTVYVMIPYVYTSKLTSSPYIIFRFVLDSKILAGRVP